MATRKRKNPHAVALGREGGKARAKNLGPKKLKQVMKEVSLARTLKQPRCPCGASTLHRAVMRAFDCCKRVNIPEREIAKAETCYERDRGVKGKQME